MSLAEQMLDTMSVSEDSESSLVDEEPHIVIDESRIAIVPAELKTIAVTGDKDIETVTFDCVRYWDGNDLSTFAIYLNYVLPDMRTGTYIPKEVVTSEGDPFYHFDWEIKDSITQKSGKISFAITAIKSRRTESGTVLLDKKWSSIPNSDCSIVLGLNISNVPSEEESEDILSQMSAILEDLQSNLTELVYSNVVQSSGYDTTKVMSQAASSKTFSNAIKGNVSGKIVAMDDVSPVEHNVPVKLRSKNLLTYPYRNPETTKNGVTFTPNSDGSITINGTPTAEPTTYIIYAGLVFSSYKRCSIGTSVTSDGFCMSITGDTSLPVSLAYEKNSGLGGVIYVSVDKGISYQNVIVYPQLELGTVATDYTPYVAENTQVAVKSFGKNLIPYPYKATTITKSGVTFTDNGDGSVTLNGTSTDTVSFVLCQGIHFFSSYTGVSGSNKVVKNGLCMSNRGVNTDKVGIAFEIWGGGIPTLIIFCNAGSTYNNAIVYPQIEVGETPTEYELYKEGETVTTTISDGAELANIAPNMTISTDKEGVIVDAEYNKDATRVIEKLTNAIIALGGSV